jgi:L-fuculose-phosphate aldolase
MTTHKAKTLLSSISKMLFNSHLFGLYSGSISTKIDHNDFVINKKKCFFASIDNERFCELSMDSKNYNWRLSSTESNMHLNIYNTFHEAKFIITAMPKHVSALMFLVDEISPKDYFGIKFFGNLKVYEPKNLQLWYENTDELMSYFKNSEKHIVLVKGIGVYAYDRDLQDLIKTFAVLEDSCKILLQEYKIK